MSAHLNPAAPAVPQTTLGTPQVKYWKSTGELERTEAFRKEAAHEFAEDLPIDELFSEENLGAKAPRRDFLKLFGFGVTAATLAACNKAPVRRAVPLLDHPEEMSASVPAYYATSYWDGHDFAAVVAKTREGRPIKLEGTPHPFLNPNGGSHARTQAAVLSLYDGYRLKTPMADGKTVAMPSLISTLRTKMQAGLPVALVTPTVISPTTKRIIQDFLAAMPGSRHVQYDSVSYAGLLEANRRAFGEAVLPNYQFENASVVLGIEADFLGNYLDPIRFTGHYIKNRKVTKENPVMSRHLQFETLLTVTGSNADRRVAMKPSQMGDVVASLYNAVAGLTGGAAISANKFELAGNTIAATAKELVAARGKSLVVCGSNDVNVQTLVIAINQMLGSYGATINMASPCLLRAGSDSEMLTLVADMEAGKIGAVILANVNPVYDHPAADKFKAALKNVPVRVAASTLNNETVKECNYVAPLNHFLENWGDAEPYRGLYTSIQPAISPIYEGKTLQIEELLLQLVSNSTPFYDYLLTQQMAWGVIGGSETTHHNFVYVGVAGTPAATGGATPNVNPALAATLLTKAEGAGNELVIYETVGLGNGVQANNPWLQELPDPITRACWDNYLTIPVKYATEQGLKDGDVVRVETNGYSVEVPVLQMPGQMPGVFGLAIGYGRKSAGKVATDIGANASPFLAFANGSFQSHRTGVKIEKTGKFSEIAQTQTHHTIEGRAIVKETSLTEYAKDAVAGNIRPHVTTKEGLARPGSVSVWEERTYNGHHWVMVIDLNACTGCGACVVSCTAENNVAVVGKKEVILRREMQWIRIDRYFAFADSKGERVDEEAKYGEIKDHANVEVVFQPMMCQQCNHAPCETVCPVLATLHSDEGLNQQIYNRCVGTRYCANNCPYKVRRFNWFLYSDNARFDYNMNNALAKMALNPDVTVRSRGVMEKCTFCVQRIQYGKLEGKKKGDRPVDGSIKTACQTSCPANAIIFGDVNDPNSEVRKMLKNERAYAVLEEINVSPNVNYLVKVRNHGPQTPNA